MDHIVINAVVGLIESVLREEIQEADMSEAMDEAAQRLAEMGVDERFTSFLLGIADNIAVGLKCELETI